MFLCAHCVPSLKTLLTYSLDFLMSRRFVLYRRSVLCILFFFFCLKELLFSWTHFWSYGSIWFILNAFVVISIIILGFLSFSRIWIDVNGDLFINICCFQSVLTVLSVWLQYEFFEQVFLVFSSFTGTCFAINLWWCCQFVFLIIWIQVDYWPFLFVL